MVALYTVWYNLVRIRKRPKVTPAMASGIRPTLWTMEDVVALIDALAEVPKPRGPDTKRPHEQAIKKRNPASALRLSRGSISPDPYATQ